MLRPANILLKVCIKSHSLCAPCDTCDIVTAGDIMLMGTSLSSLSSAAGEIQRTSARNSPVQFNVSLDGMNGFIHCVL